MTRFNEQNTLLASALRKALLIFLALAVFPYSALAQQRIVSVATLTDNPPLTFAKTDGAGFNKEIIPPGEDSVSLQGYSWDVLRESYHRQGYTIELHVLPWARAFETVRSGAIDVLFPTGFNQEHSAFFHYSTNAINDVEFMIYTRPDFELTWEGIQSVEGLTIGVPPPSRC